ncbi:MAG: hypothetical protein M3377_02950 [Actinomycetota bacterium]|nr:hypothetical protein [Actinomycetota bacterium]
MGKDTRRIAETESLYREVNERIAETAVRFESGNAEFYCECADPACTERVEATLSSYEDVRSDSTQFILAPGHSLPEVEEVVERHEGFTVIEKVEPTLAAMVTHLDPRADLA